jgi:hypothetical protein
MWRAFPVCRVARHGILPNTDCLRMIDPRRESVQQIRPSTNEATLASMLMLVATCLGVQCHGGWGFACSFIIQRFIRRAHSDCVVASSQVVLSHSRSSSGVQEGTSSIVAFRWGPPFEQHLLWLERRQSSEWIESNVIESRIRGRRRDDDSNPIADS